jgi:hypothetical protein
VFDFDKEEGVGEPDDYIEQTESQVEHSNEGLFVE